MGALVAFAPPLIFGAALVLGIGAAIRRAAGGQLPLGAVPAAGLGGLVVLGQFATLLHVPALIAGLVAAAVAVVGVIQLGTGALRDADRWAVGACALVTAVYLGTVAATGQGTFGGYTQLADTAIHLLGATYLPGGAPSDLGGAAGAAWRAYYDTGYPTGGAAALGMLAALTGSSAVPALQPLIALTMATVAASLWVLLADLVPGRRARATLAVLASMPGLTYGFAMQGSLKEVLALALLVGAAAALPDPVALRSAPARVVWRAGLPAAVALAALVAAVGGAAAVYVLPLAVVVAMPWARLAGVRPALLASVSVGGLAVLLSVPTLLALDRYLQMSGAVLTMQAERGNLASALLPKRELSGIWLGPDFRVRPTLPTVSAVLGTLTLLAAVAGGLVLTSAWWRRPTGRTAALAGWVVGGVVSVVLIVRVGSPWADWKGYAIFTPVVVVAAGVGLAAAGRRRRLERPARAVAAVLGLGILGTVAMAAHAVPVAPADRFAELERIDARFAGQGPMFTAEYEEFARALLPRTATTFAGDTFDGVPGRFTPPISGDTDGLDVSALDRFPLLLVRSGPRTSRPPGNYVRRWSGRWYEVWARDPQRSAPVARLALGTPDGAGASVPRCSAVRTLAASAGPGLVLRVAVSPDRELVPARQLVPSRWRFDAAWRVLPDGGGTRAVTLLTTPGRLVDMWFSGRDPRPLTATANELRTTIGPATFGPAGAATRIGTVRADARGRVELTLIRPERAVRPGMGDRYARWSSVGISAHDPLAATVVRTVDPADAQAVAALCRQRLDWIELAQG